MRRLLAVVLSILGLTASLLVVAAPAHADSAAYEFLSRINSARQAQGLRPLAMRSDLVSVAANWTAKMASSGDLRHNPNLTSQVKNWKSVGENVGVGPDAGTIHRAFMNSSSHRANILDGDFTEAGIATKRDAKGELWVTEVFRQPQSTSTSTSTRTAPRRTTTTSTAPERAATSPTTSRPPVTVASAPRAAAPAAAPTLSERLARLAPPPAGVDPLERAVRYAVTMGSLSG